MIDQNIAPLIYNIESDTGINMSEDKKKILKSEKKL